MLVEEADPVMTMLESTAKSPAEIVAPPGEREDRREGQKTAKKTC